MLKDAFAIYGSAASTYVYITQTDNNLSYDCWNQLKSVIFFNKIIHIK